MQVVVNTSHKGNSTYCRNTTKWGNISTTYSKYKCIILKICQGFSYGLVPAESYSPKMFSSDFSFPLTYSLCRHIVHNVLFPYCGKLHQNMPCLQNISKGPRHSWTLLTHCWECQLLLLRKYKNTILPMTTVCFGGVYITGG